MRIQELSAPSRFASNRLHAPLHPQLGSVFHSPKSPQCFIVSAIIALYILHGSSIRKRLRQSGHLKLYMPPALIQSGHGFSSIFGFGFGVSVNKSVNGNVFVFK